MKKIGRPRKKGNFFKWNVDAETRCIVCGEVIAVRIVRKNCNCSLIKGNEATRK